MACSMMFCLGFLFFSFISKAYGSNGCPKSRNVIIGGTYQNVTWATTWTDYQSKVCAWRLNFQTPEVVNFTLRLEKLTISSHDVFVYSGLGIVKKRLEDKIKVRVCGDRNQTELPTSATGKEFQFTGAALCFVVPHGDYNFGQDIFTTHFINITVGLKKQYHDERMASATGSSRRVPNRSPPITPTSNSHKTRPSVTKVATIGVSTAMTSSHADTDVTHPVRFTSVLRQSLPPLTASSKQTPTNASLITQKFTSLFLSPRQSTTNPNPLSTKQFTQIVLSNRQSTTNPPSSHYSTMSSLLNHKSTSTSFSSITQEYTLSNHKSTNSSSRKPSQIKELTTHPSTDQQITSLPKKLQTRQNIITFSYQHPIRTTFPDHETIYTKVSTHFSYSRDGSSTPHNTVTMITTPRVMNLQKTETTLLLRSTTHDHSVKISNNYSTPDRDTEGYMIAGLVSGVVFILLITIILVVYKFKVKVSDTEGSLYSTDDTQPLPWRKNWVITKSFSEIEAEQAKPDLQLKPSLPYRPSLKQHHNVSRQDAASTSSVEDNDGVYDNIVAVATPDIFPTMEVLNFERPDRYSDDSEFWNFESLSKNLETQSLGNKK